MFDYRTIDTNGYYERFQHILDWMKDNMGFRIEIVVFEIYDKQKVHFDDLPIFIKKGIATLMMSNAIKTIFEIDPKMYEFFSYLMHEGIFISFITKCACSNGDMYVKRFADI